MLNQLLEFRKKMGSFLYRDFVLNFWGIKALMMYEKNLESQLPEWKETVVYREKVDFLRRSHKRLLVFNIVKFIGISGSVAARTVDREDDIDLFIVVKNDTAWIYRFLVWIKNFGTKLIRREKLAIGTNLEPHKQRDKLCINFIVEERALGDIGTSLFTLHELLSLIPVYNIDYYENILSANNWLHEKFGVRFAFKSKPNASAYTKRNALLKCLNAFTFLGQLLYQSIHSPDFKRLVQNYQKGIIAYFPKVFKGYVSEV